MTLDERKATILRAVVEEYIETAQPVGSNHVVRAPGVNVSSATVRNDMMALEQEGFLHQPHTSAGRVPTEKGYRFFVDSLGDPRLGTTEARQVRSFFSASHGAYERMLADTTRLLADLTHAAAVVVGPQNEAATVRSVQLVGLAPRTALLVIVLSNGSVEKESIELERDVSDLELGEVTAALAPLMVGRTLPAAAEQVERRSGAGGATTGAAKGIGTDLLRVVAAMLRSREHEADEVFIGGAAQMAASFEAVATVSEILRILEEQLVVVTLLHDVLDRGLNVAIGTETGIEPLADCSVVVAPYVVDGEAAGAIGVLGPTRMNYPQALAAVAVVSQRLGTSLSEG